MNEMCHVRVCEYTVDYDFFSNQDRIALYDERDISDEEVEKLIRSGDEYHPKVVFMTKTQYDNVFRSL